MNKYTVQEFLLTYMSWMSMMQRCVYKGKRKDAPLYRDLGITVCAAWHSFEHFISDMGPRPSKGMTLDRFPNKLGNYEPGNCRWATAKQQSANTRSAVLLTWQGKTLPIAEWARVTGIGRATIQYRHHLSWSPEQIFTTPINDRNPAYTTFAQGRAHGKKLSAEQVQEIVRRASEGQTSGRALGKEFGVTGAAVYHILKQYGIKLKKGRPRAQKR